MHTARVKRCTSLQVGGRSQVTQRVTHNSTTCEPGSAAARRNLRISGAPGGRRVPTASPPPPLQPPPRLWEGGSLPQTCGDAQQRSVASAQLADGSPEEFLWFPAHAASAESPDFSPDLQSPGRREGNLPPPRCGAWDGGWPPRPWICRAPESGRSLPPPPNMQSRWTAASLGPRNKPPPTFGKRERAPPPIPHGAPFWSWQGGHTPRIHSTPGGGRSPHPRDPWSHQAAYTPEPPAAFSPISSEPPPPRQEEGFLPRIRRALGGRRAGASRRFRFVFICRVSTPGRSCEHRPLIAAAERCSIQGSHRKRARSGAGFTPCE